MTTMQVKYVDGILDVDQVQQIVIDAKRSGATAFSGEKAILSEDNISVEVLSPLNPMSSLPADVVITFFLAESFTKDTDRHCRVVKSEVEAAYLRATNFGRNEITVQVLAKEESPHGNSRRRRRN